MRGLALLALVLGLIAVFMPFTPERRGNLTGENLAVSFGEFRRAAWRFAVEHPAQQGEVAVSALPLPTTWLNVRKYRLIMKDGIACAFGSATQEEAMDVHARLGNSAAVGYVINGRLHPADLTLPVAVPEGVLLAVMEVTP